MKCEIKYIGYSCKEELKNLTVEGILGTLIVSGTLGIAFNFFFEEITVLILISLVFLLFVSGVWMGAVDYCKKLKTKTDSEGAIS